MKRFDSDRPEFSPYGFTCERWTPAGMPRPDRHNEIEVNLLGTGTLTYLFGGHRTTIEAGKLAVFWAAITTQDMYLKRNTLADWRLHPASSLRDSCRWGCA